MQRITPEQTYPLFNSEATRRVPLWLTGEGFKNTPLPTDQTQIAGLVCRAFGIE